MPIWHVPHCRAVKDRRRNLDEEKQTLTLNGAAMTGISSFYDEINRVFMADEDWDLAHSLDALDDMLYGEYGALKGNRNALVVWNDIEESRRHLGMNETRKWYHEKLARPAIYNLERMQAALDSLDAGEGKTFFEMVMEVFAGHPNVKLNAGGQIDLLLRLR